LAVSELPGASVSERVLVQNLSYENEFDLHENLPEGETVSKWRNGEMVSHEDFF
jgi:hypothetical protein